jgi:hypothetical protein
MDMGGEKEKGVAFSTFANAVCAQETIDCVQKTRRFSFRPATDWPGKSAF